MEHDLFRKPVSTFRDHAVVAPLAALRCAATRVVEVPGVLGDARKLHGRSVPGRLPSRSGRPLNGLVDFSALLALAEGDNFVVNFVGSELTIGVRLLETAGRSCHCRLFYHGLPGWLIYCKIRLELSWVD